jgi:surfeit locus 1 family protein
MAYTRPTPKILIAFLLAFSALIALGAWQIERLMWKEALIAQIASANQTQALTALPDTATELEPLAFRNVTLTGHFLPDIEFHVTPRYFRDTLGYHLFTPFQLTDGRIVIVNRGWVPAAQKDPATRPLSVPNASEHALTGQIRLGPERNYFTPPSDPKQNVWFGRDIADMAKSANLSGVLPLSVDLIGPQIAGELPIPTTGIIGLRNDHLQYALTWFLLALGLLVVFAVYHRK